MKKRIQCQPIRSSIGAKLVDYWELETYIGWWEYN
jgi:hypothetical protein